MPANEPERRRFLALAAAGLAASAMPPRVEDASTHVARPAMPGELRQVAAGVLDVGHYVAGPDDGPPVVLLHGWPYDVHSYVDVAPLLAARGCRVVVPHLRGHGSTRFADAATPRSGQQAALGVDLIALMDALRIRRAVVAGYDWGGRAACVAAALWPERCAGLVSVNGYLIQDIATASQPLDPRAEAAFWYQFYFLTARGRSGLAANRRALAKLMWRRNSPTWSFDDATFDRSAPAFDNDDYVDVVIHSYRHRLGVADGFPVYADLERRLAAQPVIAVPTITLDGDADGVVAATDGRAAAVHFSGSRTHRVVAGAGHDLPQERPDAFADAVWTLVSAAR